jgi:hypothetical protein
MVPFTTMYRVLSSNAGYCDGGECGMTAQHTEPDEPLAKVPARELRRLRALARIASPQELAEAEEAARTEELDAIEAAGQTGELSDQQARQLLGVPVRRGEEEYVTTDEVRRRLGLPR